ncbi:MULTISPECIES: thiolase C-terminal domain-containing protein [Streptacidiphilus]|uniref:Lipid-transfer protein n=1 Tax=Streptacidiphilus cavernicola TaxID=3342716 RepID=A0ABV6UUV0_9ACTN|nr:lipid-transfer protein [Streptacidiphilus jeojiense]
MSKNVRLKHSGLRDTAIVGVGATPYYKRGESADRSINQLAGEAILAACADAGLSVRDVDGLAFYSLARAGYADQMEAGEFVETLGIRELRFSAALTGGGGGSAGAIGLARAAIVAGDASIVVTVMALQQRTRLGTVFAAKASTPLASFVQPSGLAGPGHLMSLLTRRHMHQYGTTRDAFAEIAMSTRANALNRPKARYREPLTHDQYFGARMLADPLCLYDFCMESEGAVAVVTTSIERARDLRQKPVPVVSVAHGGTREWGRAFSWFGMPDDGTFASSGHKSIAQRLYQRAGVTAEDIDVALIYDHFTPMVLMQLEDYGFCAKGEGGPYVLSGAIRHSPERKPGRVSVNPHGGQLSEAYIIGATHIVEGVEQMRGTAINQVTDAELALVTGGPAALPVSGLILGRDR